MEATTERPKRNDERPEPESLRGDLLMADRGSIQPPNPFDERKESWMDPQQFSTIANKFQAVLDADVLNTRGKQLDFSKRKRLITPFRFGLSVVASMATQQVQSIADLHRQFNELWELESDYKAFYNQLGKPS